MKARKILGRLVGPVADISIPTRNGRKYSEQLWEKVFSDPITQEKFKNKVCYGELGHPEDRTEVDMEKIAVSMPEAPKRGKDGKLYAIVDILDTPCGKILNTLCQYGSTVGISSRGTGEVIDDYDGQESVDPDTYNFECFDIVLIPAVKEARLQYVNESLEKGKTKTLNEALVESVNAATPEGKKIMVEALKDCGIELKEDEKVENAEEVKVAKSNTESASNIDEEKTVVKDEPVANDNGMEVVKELQEQLRQNKILKDQVIALQEKLSVRDTKDAELQEELRRFKSSTVELSESSKKSKVLRSEVVSLQSKLKQSDKALAEKDKLIESLNEKLETTNKLILQKNAKIRQMVEAKKSEVSKQQVLNESVASKDKAIVSLKESLANERKQTATITAENKSLKENLEEAKKNAIIKSKEYSDKLSKVKQLAERYQKIASAAVDRYIEQKARTLRVSPDKIKRKLDENYSFADIDKICESIREDQISISKLPFAGEQNARFKVTQSVEPIMRDSQHDDNVDESLINLANNYMNK